MSVELYFIAGWQEPLAATGLGTFEEMIHGEPGRCVSRHTRGQTYRVESAGIGVVYLKRDMHTSLKDMLIDLLYLNKPQPPCLVELRAIRRVAALGIAAPEVVAWGQRRRWGLPWQGVLVTRELAGRPLSRMLLNDPPDEKRLEAVRGAGVVVGRLHAARLCWPDLAPKHFYIRRDGSIGVLDLARLRRDAGPRAAYVPKQVRRFCQQLARHGGTKAEAAAFRDGARQGMGR